MREPPPPRSETRVHGPGAHGDGADPVGLAQWRIGFGTVIHTRLRPVRHAFRYGAFHLRVPVHRLRGERAGSWLFGVNRPALIAFHEADHGAGGPALEWIRALVAEAGIRADGEIWLQTFPRVFGFVFKPVSFWYCHDREGQRRAIVAEVNNTFGERHCYVLVGEGGRALRNGELLQARKDFHVSPFCEVDGRYRFRFFDDGQRGVARVDHDDQAGPLITTSLSGVYRPIDAAACLRALTLHPWFTLGVVVRIHWQALQLWIKRVPWHRKPKAPDHFVTRGSR